MAKLIKHNHQSDIIGSIVGILCLIHCVATPFLFTAHAMQFGLKGGHVEKPFWWSMLDIVFIIISFFAVWWSSKNSSKQWMKIALWISWFLLALVIVNEKMALVELSEEAIYLPALTLVGLHLYNRKYCQCKEDNC